MQVKHMLALGIDISGAKKYIETLNRARTTAKMFGTDVSKSAKIVGQKQTKMMQKGGMEATKYTTTLIDGNRKIQASYKHTGKSTQYLSTGVKQISNTTKKAIPLMQHFQKALARVAIVVPVWMLFRSAMMAVMQTLKEGFRYWMEFDKAINKSRQVIHKFTGDLDMAVDILTSRIKELSIETGLSMAKLSGTFYRFGTVGLDFETSVKGMEVATKLANVMFGDSEKTAIVLSQAYRLLGDTIDQNIPKHQRMGVVGAQIAKLWKTNAFELNEFTGALQQFLPVANVFNFSITESIGLLATLQTAGLKNTKAGRLLRTSISKLVENLDQVAGELGVHVNPALDSTFDVLMRVLGAVKKLESAGGELPIEAIEAMGIFGGVRSKQAGMALVAMYDLLQENLEAINTGQGKYNRLLKDLEEQNARILKQVFKQEERFKNLKVLMGKAFVEGITGAENFANAMANVNIGMEKGISRASNLGNALALIFKLAMNNSEGFEDILKRIDVTVARSINNAVKSSERLRKGLSNALTGEELDALLKDMQEFKKEFKDTSFGKDFFDRMGLSRESVIKSLEKIRKELEAVAKDEKPIKFPFDTTGEGFDSKKGVLSQQLKVETESRLKLMQHELKYIDMQNDGLSQSVIAEERLKDLVEEKVRKYNNLDMVLANSYKIIDKQHAVSLALKGNYEEMKGLFFGMFIDQTAILEIEKLRQKSTLEGVTETLKITKRIVKHELDLAKIRGLSGKHLLEYKNYLEEIHGIGQNEFHLLDKKLNLEKSITQEKEDQKNISSDAVKIWEISLKHGQDLANEVRDIVAGQKAFVDASSGAMQILATDYPSKLKQFQAGEYYKETGTQTPEEAKQAQELAEQKESQARKLEDLMMNTEYLTNATEEYIKAMGRAPQFKYELEPERMKELPQRKIPSDLVPKPEEAIPKAPTIIAPTIPIEVKSEINVMIDDANVEEKVGKAVTKELEEQGFTAMLKDWLGKNV